MTRDIIAIGASSGGLDALCKLLAGLPGNLPASVLIVQHVGATSMLAQIFANCGPLKVVTARDREEIRRGQAYVAPGDQHLLINDGHIELSKGARENRHRPSIDALFRSTARSYRSRVIAVVLSGALDDGAAGAFGVKARGGLVVVQEPTDALVPDMPRAVLRAVDVDFCVPLSEMPALLTKLANQPVPAEKRKAERNKAILKPERESSTPSPFTCPDCSGPLYEVKNGKLSQYRCIVGHIFSPESLSEAHREALERALLTSLRTLHERMMIQQALAAKSSEEDRTLRPRFKEAAEAAAKDAALLREILERI